MDELGVDRALMFPTLASLLEERLRDDPEMIHAVVHSLNEWLHETWSFNYENRIFTVPVDLAADRRQGDRGARVGARARRADHPDPPCAGSRLRPFALVRLPGVRSVLEAGGGGRHPRLDALRRQRLRPLSERLDRPDGDAAVQVRRVPA